MRIDPVIFRQYDIRGTVGADLTTDVARAVGVAMGSEAAQRLARTPVLAVGRDNRPSGEALEKALIEGLLAAGAQVRDVGLLPTPTLYFAIHHLAADGGVQVTGSHNPPEMNGFKMVLGGLPFAGDDIQGLRERIVADRFASGRGAVTTHDVLDAYGAEIDARIGRLARPLSVVVDCGNGMPGLTYPGVLERARRQGGPAVLRVGRHLPQPPPRPDGARQPPRPPGAGAAQHGRPRDRVRRRRRPDRRGGRDAGPCCSATRSSPCSARTWCAAWGRARRSSST